MLAFAAKPARMATCLLYTSQGVRENHAALAVGVEDLNRLAREGGDDVARLGGAARGLSLIHILSMTV